MQINDKKINNLFYYWLITSFIMVFIMVLVGGLTRLTNSGLSITEWELFKGILPPTSIETWDRYFSLYKKIPQYYLLNNSMTLEEFKIIFYWEYFHRILGRLIGLFFIIPLIFFYFDKRINKKYLINCSIILFLIIIQGIVGWYMVESGLVNNVTVSHYRLSLHLTIALIIISLLFWNILNFKNQREKLVYQKKKGVYFYYLLASLILLQVVLGAFVSGLDAGKVYQTWPLMNLNYFPDDYNINQFSDLLNFKDHGLVQFYHRNIAYLITIILVLYGIYVFKKNIEKLKKPFYLIFFILLIQIFLGVTTLISGLNIYLASAHQIFGVLLILSAINLYFYYIK